MPVRLLFDENVAPRLVRDLADVFPDSAHVRDLNLQAASDQEVWVRASAGRLVIVTKDDDFRQRSFLHGHPPKVIWVRLGNCRTADVAVLLRAREAEVRAFVADPQLALLALGHRRP
jgi:predicted nuclease of predicted toxin-antitoxin system